MNYVLQVVRGRSANTTLKLASGITSVGRHDDCVIRIKSSQVSRRHCELFESEGKLNVRDLGSANGTYVNGKRVLGSSPVFPGDELTIGSVTLRIATAGGGVKAQEPTTITKPKPGDTAVVEAVPAADDDEFELEFEDDEPVVELDVIPLAGESPAPAKKETTSKAAPAAQAEPPAAPANPNESEAIDQFLLDLKLDDE
jgi:hypothetical protein